MNLGAVRGQTAAWIAMYADGFACSHSTSCTIYAMYNTHTPTHPHTYAHPHTYTHTHPHTHTHPICPLDMVIGQTAEEGYFWVSYGARGISVLRSSQKISVSLKPTNTSALDSAAPCCLFRILQLNGHSLKNSLVLSLYT